MNLHQTKDLQLPRRPNDVLRHLHLNEDAHHNGHRVVFLGEIVPSHLGKGDSRHANGDRNIHQVEASGSGHRTR